MVAASSALQPVPRPAAALATRRIAQIAVLAALAIAGRIAFLWAPNFALTYYIVFLAGLLLGVRAGIAVAVIAMTATNLVLTGLSPILLANATGMSVLGVLGGTLRPLLLAATPRRVDRVFSVTLLAAAGLFGTFLFSIASDLIGFLLQFVLMPEGAQIGTRALVPMLLVGLVFNLGPALMNAALFGLATPPLLVILRSAGHLPAPRRAPARIGPVRSPLPPTATPHPSPETETAR